MRLHGYFRSSAAYRVRIALGLKGLEAAQISYHLRDGAQRSEAFLKLNPQGLVPAFETDKGDMLIQSLAIIGWLDDTYPQAPLIPKDSLLKARVMAFSYAIACDIHPVQNLKVLKRLRSLGHNEEQVQEWAAWVNAEGLAACETLLANEKGAFCFGDTPSIADICLVPQLSNARRFKVDVRAFPKLLTIEANCKKLEAFSKAAPELQHDAE